MIDAAELLDLADPDVVADPYPRFAALRQRAPLARHSGLGMYVATGYEQCAQVLRERGMGRTFQPRVPAAEWETFNWLHADAILENEPPTHTRLRRLVQGAFGRGHVERLRPRVEALTTGLLDRCAERLSEAGSFDVIAELAEPLPVLVIAELLGWPEADRHLLRPWSQAIVKMYEVDRTPEQEAAAIRASDDFAAYTEQLAAERTSHPDDDLLSDLVRARDGADRLTTRELIATVVLLLNAGHEASVNGFGNGIVSLLESGRAAGAVAPLIDEMLRHDSPLQMFVRTAFTDVEITGTTIRAGESVAALLGAANRDPAVFDQPDRFVPERDPNRHLAFGLGIHFCLGAPLARLELAVGVEALLRRFGPLRVAEAHRRPTFVLRGYERVALTRG